MKANRVATFVYLPQRFREALCSGSIRRGVFPWSRQLPPATGAAIEIRHKVADVAQPTRMRSSAIIIDAVVTDSWETFLVDGMLVLKDETPFVQLGQRDEWAQACGWAGWDELVEHLERDEEFLARRTIVLEWVPCYDPRKMTTPDGKKLPTLLRGDVRYARQVMAFGVLPRTASGHIAVDPHRKVLAKEFPAWDYSEISKVTPTMRRLRVGEAMVLAPETVTLFRRWVRDSNPTWRIMERPISVGAVAVYRLK